MRPNVARVIAASRALHAHTGQVVPDGEEAHVEAMTDLIADLHHLADCMGLDWIKITDLAEIHHDDEAGA